jgi:hypothetical protein
MTNIKTFMLTTDSGANEDYNVFYCPIYRVSGPGDFSESVFQQAIGTKEWVQAVEDLGYDVERVELSYVIMQDEDEEDEE